MSGARWIRARAQTAAFGLLGVLVALAPGASAASSGTTAVGLPHRILRPRGYVAPRLRVSSTAGALQFAGQGPCGIKFCWSPGEPTLAVGPNDVVQTVNTSAAVYSKTGTHLATFDFSSFWGPSTTECVDPRALYIASINRFAISCTDITPGEGTAPMRFAISETPDPAGAWYRYAAPNTGFLDQDKIEATADKFIIAGNGANESMYVYGLSQLASGVANPNVVALTATKSSLYQAVVQQTPTDPGYFVSSYPGGKLVLATVTGTPGGGNVALRETTIASWDFPAPLEPQVPGGSIGGQKLDGRVYDAVYERQSSNGEPIIAYSSARECGLRACVTMGRIGLSDPTPVLLSNRLIGEPGWDYSYGAVGLAASGYPFVVYARSRPSSTPGMAVLGPGFDVTLQPSSAGTTACASGSSPPCDESWGDYLGTAIDPSNPSTVWVSGLYQAQSGPYGWQTVIARVSATTFSLPGVATGAPGSITATGAQLAGSVNPRVVPTTYHFDYGLTTGYDTATAARSAGSGTGPVGVSAFLSGLDPGTRYHYRLVATTSRGSATGPDRTFRTTSPMISSVHFTGTPSDPTVTVVGSHFGRLAPANPSSPHTCAAGDTSHDYGTSGLWFDDVTRAWRAGQSGDCIGLIVRYYSSTKIVYGFGADYSSYGQVTDGDAYTLTVWGRAHSGTVGYG